MGVASLLGGTGFVSAMVWLVLVEIVGNEKIRGCEGVCERERRK